MYRVFFYGTLKRNQPNYPLMEKLRLANSAQFVGEARTVEKFPLVVATDLNVPFLLYRPGEGHSIHGELYDVNETALGVLDEFELRGIVYEREELRVRLDAEEQNAWTYVYKTAGKTVLELPRLENYDNAEMTKEGKAYSERSTRTSSVAEFDHQLRI